ncbi:MAG: type II toxin-antitoxin system RelE/ParE family toxin [Fulvimarina manganoxydans]|nr:type II toxin-antitoxin system RelE/ParE family toxin [Fulvimarina manganoxydans]
MRALPDREKHPHPAKGKVRPQEHRSLHLGGIRAGAGEALHTHAISRAIERIAAGEGRASPVTEIGGDYSKVSVGSHIVYLRITEEEVVIVRILHSRMNAPDHL